MKLQKYILPVFVGSKLLAQNEASWFPQINLGFAHAVYNSTSFKATPVELAQKEFHHKRSKVTETQYGFGIGVFLWMPLNAGIVFKPKIEGTFSTTCARHAKAIFATAFDLSISHGFAISLKSPDPHGVIYAAKDMSCYLTTKQPYLLIGPRLNLKKFDAGYISKGYQNEFSYGFFIGYGINYEFHGTNVVPEISYGVSSTAQNPIDGSKKVVHTLTLALNFF
ncbi:MAG: hypothetical protein V4580_15285 [Bacteroidota bacterium]